MDVPSRSDANPPNLRVRRWNEVILNKINGFFLYLINMNVIGKLLVASCWYTSISKYTA